MLESAASMYRLRALEDAKRGKTLNRLSLDEHLILPGAAQIWLVGLFLNSILSCINRSDVLQTHTGFPLWMQIFILAQHSQNFQIPAVMRVRLRLLCSDSFTNGFSRWCMFTKPSEQLTALSFEDRWFCFLFFSTTFVLINVVSIPRQITINSLFRSRDIWICCSYLWMSAFGALCCDGGWAGSS